MNIKTVARQCIRTKYISCTNFRPSRVKARCERGHITVSWKYEMNVAENHAYAIRCLVEKFIAEDAKNYGSEKDSAWDAEYIMGGDRDGYVAVFAD